MRLFICIICLCTFFGCSSGGTSTPSPSNTAASFPPAPCGIYALDGLNGIYRDGNIAKISNLKYVDGYVLRLKWEELETSNGVYNFAPIEHNLNMLKGLNKKLSLVIMGYGPPYLGTDSEYDGPTWTDLKGVKRSVPWSDFAKSRSRAFYSALANATITDSSTGTTTMLKNHPLMEDLHLSIPGIGRIREQDFLFRDIPGYDRSLLISGIQHTIDTALELFPSTFIIVSLWSVTDTNHSPELWDSIQSSLSNRYDGVVRPKIGIAQDNLAASTDSNTHVTTGYPSTVYASPLFAVKEKLPIIFQMLTSWSAPFTSPEKVAGSTPITGMEYGRNTYGTKYFEVYDNDLTSATYKPLFETWNKQCGE